METNIRIVNYGNNLFLSVRKVSISKTDLTSDELHTICTLLKNRKIAATPYAENDQYFLLIQSHDVFKSLQIELENSKNKGTKFTVLLNSLSDVIKLEIKNPAQRKLIEELYLKRIQINILQKTSLKIIKKSPNVYYDTKPIEKEEDQESDIVAYRRYFVFAEYIEGQGLGFGVDIGNSYFTRNSVEEFYATGNQERFHYLRERQSTEYKGTLLYKGPKGYSRCYFDRYDGKTTILNTDPFSYAGVKYTDSFDYFKRNYPDFPLKETDKIAFVSFKGMGTLPVPAKCLFLAVSTENITEEFNQDRYTAQQKRNLIDGFWNMLRQPFGYNYLDLNKNYYVPKEDGGTFDLPPIMYGGKQVLNPPSVKNPYLYKKYYLNKYLKLKETGCYYVPPVMEREVHFIFPEETPVPNSNRLVDDIVKDVSLLTKKSIEAIDHTYKRGEHLSAIYDLKNNYDLGTVVFVFDSQDPSIYYNISQELQGWKIIRLTKQELGRKYNKLKNHPKGKSNWETYVSLNSFKIVTELGCIPYIFNAKLEYNAQLIIDVSEKYSHFGLGLLIYKEGMPTPIFDYIIKPNPDSKNDLINPYLLEKYLTELLSSHLETFKKYGINRLLALRDGIENKSEYDVFLKVIKNLKEKDRGLAEDFDFAFIEYHKKSLKSIRLFDFQNGEFRNPLEGSWFKINRHSAILMNTGEGTLTQGTSSPVLIKSNYKDIDLIAVLKDIFLTSQLNFGSPRVAQKITYLAKRIDDLLKEKRAQEVIKIK